MILALVGMLLAVWGGLLLWRLSRTYRPEQPSTLGRGLTGTLGAFSLACGVLALLAWVYLVLRPALYG